MMLVITEQNSPQVWDSDTNQFNRPKKKLFVFCKMMLVIKE